MAHSQNPDRESHPQSIGNLALAHVILETLPRPNSNAEEGQLHDRQDEQQDEPDDDPLGPSRGMVNGLRLSITLWSVIVLIILLMW